MAYDERTAERVRRLLADRKDVVEKKMMGGLCFMVDGAICCSVSAKGGLLIRVRADDYAGALGEAHAKPMKLGKRVMRGFVRIEPNGYRTSARLTMWVLRGVDGAKSVPPKKAASGRKKTTSSNTSR